MVKQKVILSKSPNFVLLHFLYLDNGTLTSIDTSRVIGLLKLDNACQVLSIVTGIVV